MAGITIQGGRVIDPLAGTAQARPLHILDGHIVDSLPAPPDRLIDVAGAWIAPGFIDLHTHVFSHGLFGSGLVTADRIGVEQGVACVVDAGSAGAATIEGFNTYVMPTQRTSVFAFINIGSPGLPHLTGGHSSRPEFCDLAATVRAFERHGEWLVGVKMLASQSHAGSFGIEATKLARKAAELVGKPMMVHIGNAPPVIDDVLELLRPGDIVTHAYHGKTGGVLGYRDRVIPAFREAVERGVIVDLGHGQSSFSFRTCEIALEQGMPVHCISTDLHRGSLARQAVSLARTMCKMRALGFSLFEVVRAVTRAPADAIGIGSRGFGALTAGRRAHATVFLEIDEHWELEDAEGERRVAPSRIEPVGVLIGDAWYERSAPL